MKRDITTDAGRLLLDMYFGRNTADEEDARQLIIKIEEQAQELARRASPFTYMYNSSPFNTSAATTVTYRFDNTSGSNAITTLTNEPPSRNL